MAICPRCRHDDKDKKVSNRICKNCYRDLVNGTQPRINVSTLVDSLIEGESYVGMDSN